MSFVVQTVLLALIAGPAIILHEVSHGYVALLLGDTTARDSGRLTLNPLKHIDPFGTLLLPLLLAASTRGAVVFGYAKPVPFNPWNFRGDRRLGMLLTGGAGPATNILLGAASALVLRVLPSQGPAALVTVFFLYFALVNLTLAFFNLIPVPPLDGSRVLQYFLPDRAVRGYMQLERYGILILLGVLWLLPGVLGAYFDATARALFRLLAGA